MFECGEDVRVVGEVEECGRDGGCGCVGAGDDEQYGFAKEFVRGVGHFAGVRVFGLEEVVEHVVPTASGLFAVGLLVVFVAVVKRISYFEFAALNYARLNKVVEFLNLSRGDELEEIVETTRLEPDP